MDRIKPLFLISLILILLFSRHELFAQGIIQTININSSPNPVGSGARAMGM